jgi:hypothetical protein
MRCNPSARWGPGTTKEREVDTESSKQLKSKMEEMMKEREKQNSMWTQAPPGAQDQVKAKPQVMPETSVKK